MIIVKNPRGDAPVPVPTHTEGHAYRFEMIFDGGARRAYADTWTELNEAIIGDDYDELGPDDSGAAERLFFAVGAQVQLQALILDRHPAAVKAEIEDRHRQILLATRDTPPLIGEWDCEVPLVLVTVYYDPYDSTARPQGLTIDGVENANLIWIDPSDEETLVRSLDRAGVIQVFESATAGLG